MLRIFWPRLLRLLTRNRHVPLDAELRARYGTWGWLTGEGMWKPTTPKGQFDDDSHR
ncbi:hypothetical protein [Nonomuraea sp. SYSU D8015]|uniref:hypothetical protein n=1 Tax=Nonomuraea sp. SYSU D8015 TaxID=2593644 RepID=UPI00166020AC|nr:hypothetical protein [Nonomuraea sp. SYSU D8015]